jgi:hypothetical protein
MNFYYWSFYLFFSECSLRKNAALSLPQLTGSDARAVPTSSTGIIVGMHPKNALRSRALARYLIQSETARDGEAASP